MMEFCKVLATELNLPQRQVEAAVELIDAGNTIPFIARYRKEATGAMDDQVLRQLADRLEYLRGLEKRRQEVDAAIRQRQIARKQVAVTEEQREGEKKKRQAR